MKRLQATTASNQYTHVHKQTPKPNIVKFYIEYYYVGEPQEEDGVWGEHKKHNLSS